MKITYSPDADVLIIQLRQGKPVDTRDIAEGIIIHFSAKGQPLAIESSISYSLSPPTAEETSSALTVLAKFVPIWHRPLYGLPLNSARGARH